MATGVDTAMGGVDPVGVDPIGVMGDVLLVINIIIVINMFYLSTLVGRVAG